MNKRRISVWVSLVAVSSLTVAGWAWQGGKAPVQVWEKPLAPGLIYRMEVDPNTPRTINAVRLSPGSPTLTWNPELAGGTMNEEGTTKGRLTPTDIAASGNALVVVNGDFFSYEQGSPIGQIVRKGELLNTAFRQRAVFAWGPKDVGIGMASAKATVSLAKGPEIDIDRINQPPAPTGLTLYTPAIGIANPPQSNLTLVLKMPDTPLAPDGTVEATYDYALPDARSMPVTLGRALLIATGDMVHRVASLHPGESVRIRVRTKGFDWSKFDNEIGGGPFLLRDGKVAVDAVDEGFNQDFMARHPRSAIGRTAEGDVWIATVDGRQACSIGANLEELAGIMQHLGCVDAINLDGGGSTALNLLGLTVNRPSDGVERPVSSVVAIYGPKPTPPEGKLKIVLPPVAAKGIGTASVTLDGKLVANTDILWTARGAAWIDQGGILHGLHRGTAKVMARVLGRRVEATLSVSGPPVENPRRIMAADQ